MVLLFYAILTILIASSRFIGKKWLPGYFLGGLIFGFYNEVYFESAWNYSEILAPMIWQDVPLVVILGWGGQAIFALSISDRIIDTIKPNKKFVRLIIDMLVFTVINSPNEYLWSKLGVWEYNYPEQISRLGQIFSYFLLGALILSLGRRLQSYFND